VFGSSLIFLIGLVRKVCVFLELLLQATVSNFQYNRSVFSVFGMSLTTCKCLDRLTDMILIQAGIQQSSHPSLAAELPTSIVDVEGGGLEFEVMTWDIFERLSGAWAVTETPRPPGRDADFKFFVYRLIKKEYTPLAIATSKNSIVRYNNWVVCGHNDDLIAFNFAEENHFPADRRTLLNVKFLYLKSESTAQEQFSKIKMIVEVQGVECEFILSLKPSWDPVFKLRA
jgi:hypothetical protein